MRLLYRAVAAGAVGAAGLTPALAGAQGTVQDRAECQPVGPDFEYRSHGRVEEQACPPWSWWDWGTGDDDGYGGGGGGNGGNGDDGYGGPGGTPDTPAPSGSVTPTPGGSGGPAGTPGPGGSVTPTPGGSGGPAGTPGPDDSGSPSPSTSSTVPGGGGVAGSPSGAPGGGGGAAGGPVGGGGITADDSGGGGSLAATGPSSGGLTALGILFIVGGAAVLWLNRGHERLERSTVDGGPAGPADPPYPRFEVDAQLPVPVTRARTLRSATPAQRPADSAVPAPRRGRHAADEIAPPLRRRRPSPTPTGRHHAR